MPSEEFWKPVREQIQLMDRLGAAARGREKRLMASAFHSEQPVRIYVLGPGVPDGEVAAVKIKFQIVQAV